MQGLGAHPAFDAQLVRRDFPILSELVNGHPLIWLDNAATTQKPQAVIDRLTFFYQHENSNIHRAAMNWLSARPMLTKARGKRYVASSTLHRPMKSFFSGEQPRRSTSSLPVGAGRTSGKGTK